MTSFYANEAMKNNRVWKKLHQASVPLNFILSLLERRYSLGFTVALFCNFNQLLSKVKALFISIRRFSQNFSQHLSLNTECLSWRILSLYYRFIGNNELSFLGYSFKYIITFCLSVFQITNFRKFLPDTKKMVLLFSLED